MHITCNNTCGLIAVSEKKSHKIRQHARPECTGYSTDDNKNHNDKSKKEVGIS